MIFDMSNHDLKKDDPRKPKRVCVYIYICVSVYIIYIYTYHRDNMISHDINRFYPTTVNILAEPEAVDTTTSLLELRIQQVLGGGSPRSQLAICKIGIEMKSLDYADCTYMDYM